MSRDVMRVAVCAWLGLLATPFAMAQDGKAGKSSRKPAPSEGYEEMLARYLDQARARPATAAPGEAWSWMNGLALDPRARRVNDILTINVVENITASGSADAALAKASDGTASIPGLFGLQKKASALDPSSLVSAKTAADFKGSGTTTRAGQLTAQLTARVTEVLPNGDLVLEGLREITINGDHQVVVLTGVARVADIASTNVLQSTSIANLSIRYFGRGLIKDNLNPGWLIRVLNKIF